MSNKTIAIIGAGPGVGLAIARKFAREGFKVALLARNAAKLATLVEQLTADGTQAKAFLADVVDRDGLRTALEQAAAHFGGIDVLEYSPSPTADTLRGPLDIDVDNIQFHLDLSVLAPIAAVRTLLPDWQKRGSGAFLFTTAASAQFPIVQTASFGVAAGALLNYVRVLNQGLAKDNIYAGIVSIAGLVVAKEQAGGLSQSGLPLLAADAIAELHWDLYTRRDRIEAIAGDLNILRTRAGFQPLPGN